ncbi:hypothetical protein YPPY94_0815, partial [Yersinia pestis PY-94]
MQGRVMKGVMVLLLA